MLLFCSQPSHLVVLSFDTKTWGHLQTHIYRAPSSSLRKRISVFGMYSQEGHTRRVFLELGRKGCIYNHACGRWCGNMYHEIQSPWEGVTGAGTEGSTKFFLVSSPAPWIAHTPTHILPGYFHPDTPVVSLVPLVQSCYSHSLSPPPMNMGAQYRFKLKYIIGQGTQHSSPPPISFILKNIRTLTTIMMDLLPGTL